MIKQGHGHYFRYHSHHVYNLCMDPPPNYGRHLIPPEEEDEEAFIKYAGTAYIHTLFRLNPSLSPVPSIDKHSLDNA